MPTPQTRRFQGTWLGRPGTQLEHRLASGPTGLRAIFHQWADEPTGQFRLVEGDARKGTLVEHVVVDGVDAGAVAEWVAANG
jgi:hypothetical protein